MSNRTLTRLRLAGGIYEGVLSGARKPPPLVARLDDRIVAQAAISDMENRADQFLVRFDLPASLIDDRAQVIDVTDADTGDVLDRVGILAGDALNEDLRAEVALLRAELDLLKGAFRRHCQETGED